MSMTGGYAGTPVFMPREQSARNPDKLCTWASANLSVKRNRLAAPLRPSQTRHPVRPSDHARA